MSDVHKVCSCMCCQEWSAVCGVKTPAEAKKHFRKIVKSLNKIERMMKGMRR
jgi:hypothetical protein